MLCENCGENEANVKFTQVINQYKKEQMLCEECAKKMGIHTDFHFDFNLPIGIQSFLGDFLTGEEALFPSFTKTKEECDCKMTYDDFINLGKFGCSNCYTTFGDHLDQVFKNLQGRDRHVGRKRLNIKQNNAGTNNVHTVQEKSTSANIQTESKKDINKDKLQELKENLKAAIQQERYEEAAKIRDEIKELEKKK